MECKHPLAMIMLVLVLPGCREPDDRVSELARQAVTEQARQNERMGQHTQQIAQASERLIAADAQSRSELLQAQQALQQEIAQQRRQADQQRDQLERERQQLARQRQQAPVIAEAIRGAGMLLACVLPLILSIYVLRYLATSTDPSADLSHLLIEELVSEHPRLLAAPCAAPPQSSLPEPTLPQSEVPQSEPRRLAEASPPGSS
jgi:hypothetical protein